MADEMIVENLPVHLNLGDPCYSPIGRATAFRQEDGKTRIEITLDVETSEMLKDLVAIFELKGIGFAGVARKQEE